jgi:simple sugar transport system permease protein
MEAVIAFLFASIRYGTPLLLGTTGEIIAEKSGHLNLGVEGMMAVGAICGYLAACSADSMAVGILVSFLAAACTAMVYAVLTITFQANQNVSGLALTIFGLGLYNFIGLSLSSADKFPKLQQYDRLLTASSNTGIPLLRDIPVIGQILFSHSILVYISLIVAVAAWIYMVKTCPGLRTRAIGENPAAADACGVNVTLFKYLNVVFGGGITGIGGLYLAVVINGGSWNDTWINGFGWISVALVIFANWSPVRAIIGSYFFGMLMMLKPYKGNLVENFPKLSWLTAIPDEFYQMLPFLITALVLIFSSMQKKKKGVQPAACGVNYYREER